MSLNPPLFFTKSGSLPPRPESAQSSTAVEDDDPDFMFHHFLADTQYGRGFSAEVFTLEEDDMEDELFLALSEFLREGFIASFGYSVEEVPFDESVSFDDVEINGF